MVKKWATALAPSILFFLFYSEWYPLFLKFWSLLKSEEPYWHNVAMKAGVVEKISALVYASVQYVTSKVSDTKQIFGLLSVSWKRGLMKRIRKDQDSKTVQNKFIASLDLIRASLHFENILPANILYDFHSPWKNVASIFTWKIRV